VSTITATRCFNHAQREAAARCTVCGTFLCRECITEHNGRMICARCLLPGDTARDKRRFLSGIMRMLQLLGGVLVLWFVFFLMGQALLKLPTSFHEGSLWAPTESQR
jgi:hypothetical protein